jgi:hypothetical protein
VLAVSAQASIGIPAGAAAVTATACGARAQATAGAAAAGACGLAVSAQALIGIPSVAAVAGGAAVAAIACGAREQAAAAGPPALPPPAPACWLCLRKRPLKFPASPPSQAAPLRTALPSAAPLGWGRCAGIAAAPADIGICNSTLPLVITFRSFMVKYPFTQKILAFPHGSRPKVGAIVGHSALNFCIKSSILRALSLTSCAALNLAKETWICAISGPFPSVRFAYALADAGLPESKILGFIWEAFSGGAAESAAAQEFWGRCGIGSTMLCLRNRPLRSCSVCGIGRCSGILGEVRNRQHNALSAESDAALLLCLRNRPLLLNFHVLTHSANAGALELEFENDWHLLGNSQFAAISLNEFFCVAISWLACPAIYLQDFERTVLQKSHRRGHQQFWAASGAIPRLPLIVIHRLK